MSSDLFPQLPWVACKSPVKQEFLLRNEGHDISLVEEAFFEHGIVAPRLQCYNFQIESIGQMVKNSSVVAKLIPDKKAHSNAMPVLLVYRVFDAMEDAFNWDVANPLHHRRLPFKFNHPCVRPS
jgi:hypothetical protein